MFQNNTVFNFFRRGSFNKLSTQQLYTLYKISSKFNNGLTFTQFCVYLSLYLRVFNTENKTFIVLNNMFFLKTVKLIHTRNVKSFEFFKNVPNTTTKFTNLSIVDFWKKFQKLRRPQTEDTFGEYYLNTFRSKLEKYNKIGFITLFNSFYLIRSKSEFFLQNAVRVNRPLLISPKYASSTINKYLELNKLQEFEFQFLRKNKVYNKGRYSRCRQNYRTGVYMCMYLSVVSIFGLYYWFYKFSFNFTYLWWLFIAFIASFFLPKIIKYRLYEPTTLFTKIFDIFKWIFLLIKSVFF